LFDKSAAPNSVSGIVPVDIMEKDGKYVVRASMPGINPDNIELTVENDILTIRGTTQHEAEFKDAKVYRREVSSGSFTRSIHLPENVDVDAVEATFADGIVSITMPQVIEQKPEPRRIALQAKPKAVEA
ncbi:MAG: Hsp20/alpha crystallin family protein, partial [Chthonomonas sp.]|nr:Hsp20/alpha crystallin family protein [Chthonomonas sp.]